MNPAYVLKVRGGVGTYVKHDGKVGTAGKGALIDEEVSFTLAATQDQTLFQPIDFRHMNVGEEDDASGTLQAKPNGGYSLNYQPGVLEGHEGARYVVRRLIPVECERLQGFPDGWTDLTGDDPDEILSHMPQYREADEKGKRALERKVRKWCGECPDGPRYKAIGNSMAVPVMMLLGERIELVENMASNEGASSGAPHS